MKIATSDRKVRPSRRRLNQQADDQRQTGEELGAAGQCRHQVTRVQADAFHVLRGAGQTVTTEQTEEFCEPWAAKITPTAMRRMVRP